MGSGPLSVVVFNWLGWAGLMCMLEAVKFTIVGLHTLFPRQSGVGAIQRACGHGFLLPAGPGPLEPSENRPHMDPKGFQPAGV